MEETRLYAGTLPTLDMYEAIDKLQKLDAATVEKLFQDGMLGAIYAHRFSLDNWVRLLERRQRLSRD